VLLASRLVECGVSITVVDCAYANPDVISADLWGFFRAGHIATEIKGAVTVEQSEHGSIAYRRLAEQRFDQAPVVSQDRIVGWVLASQLSDSETVDSAMTPLDNSAIVSAESSITSVLQLLGRHNLVFTADKDGLAGFIVPSEAHAVEYLYIGQLVDLFLATPYAKDAPYGTNPWPRGSSRCGNSGTQ
jgi:CBS domain-containing protein